MENKLGIDILTSSILTLKKGKFSLDEDLKLLTLYKKLGPKWATIAKFFENRTADMVKNRFHSSIKKNMKFLEDVEIDCSYTNFHKECDYENGEISRFESQEESTNFMNFMPDQIESSLTTGTISNDPHTANNMNLYYGNFSAENFDTTIKEEENTYNTYNSYNTAIYNTDNNSLNKKRDFEFLKAETTINLNYLQTAEAYTPSWQLEDYFIL